MKRGFGTYLRAIEPITRLELSQMLQKARPPPGWGETIAVANSGGPDSTCLLFLLHQYFNPDRAGALTENNLLPPTTTANEPRVISLTVDHGLQASSTEMAAKTASFSLSLGVEHLTSKIVWGQGIFPPRPPPGSFEETARRARYRLLFDEMTRLRATTLALGHHLDDQVETALMRLGMGSSILGASGMKYCRRWGMGDVIDGLDWAGYQGMKRWMVRPFLDVTKDRILATCEANQLEYVVDKTNFQPEATLRNAIRHVIQHGKGSTGSLPPASLKQLEDINMALKSFPVFEGGLHSGPTRLREFVEGLVGEVAELEGRVDAIIQNKRLPSPQGTFSISQETISDLKKQPALQTVLILRILRYVSPKPWGSLQAQGKRRLTRIAELANRLMRPPNGSSRPVAFAMGSEVLWKPVYYRQSQMKEVTSAYSPRSEDILAWLAYRQPPDSQTAHGTAERDLTTLVLDSVASRRSSSKQGVLDILYDCRFLVQIDLEAFPEELIGRLSASEAQLILGCDSQWFYPTISLQSSDGRELLHNKIDDGDDGAPAFEDKKLRKIKSSGWANIKFIRTLSTL